MSVKAHKLYLADKKPYYGHFQPRSVAITAVRSVAIQGLLVFNGFVAALELEEEEEDSEDEDVDDEVEKLKKKVKKEANKKKPAAFEPPSGTDFGHACLTSFVKSVSITTCVRTLEEIAILYFRPQIVGKFVKDLGKSAARKYARTHSRVKAAAYMLKTGMRGNVLGHISIFLIEEAHQAIVILYKRYKASKGKKKLGDGKDKEDADVSIQFFLEITAKNASRSGLAILTGGVGAAVGTFIRPGLGTVIGATLGDTIAYMV